MSELTIEVKKRRETGKNSNRRLRAGGSIPAVVYGGGRDTMPIEVDRKRMGELLKKSGSENPIFLLRLADTGQERHAMIRDMQIDPLGRHIVHIDFQRILLTERVRVRVPVEITGVAYGVKTEGGMLDFVTREVEIECLPGDIPAHLELDVTDLRVGQHAEAKDLKLPAGVTLHDDADKVLVSLGHAKVAAAEAAGGEALLESDRAEPEVIRRGKVEE